MAAHIVRTRITGREAHTPAAPVIIPLPARSPPQPFTLPARPPGQLFTLPAHSPRHLFTRMHLARRITAFRAPGPISGRIAKSSEAKREFMRDTGFPHGRPGYVIDHIVPLKRGGADAPSNMQWQTIADAKAKDKAE
jgi:hypothetical protein